MSFGVGEFVHIFGWWDWHVGKSDVVVEFVGLFSFKKCSLVTSSSETCHYCATLHSYLVGNIGSFGVVVLSEGTSDIGYHFLNIMSRIGCE